MSLRSVRRKILTGSVGGTNSTQRRGDAVARVLERRCSPGRAGRRTAAAAGGQRRRRPERAGLFVADEERLAGRIADRIVAPRRQPVVVAVDRPGVAGAALGGGEAEGRVGDDVRPRRRRQRARSSGSTAIDVFAAVVGEAADAVEQLEVGGRRRARARLGVARCAGRGAISAIRPASGSNGIWRPLQLFVRGRRRRRPSRRGRRRAAASDPRAASGRRAAGRRRPACRPSACSGLPSTICMQRVAAGPAGSSWRARSARRDRRRSPCGAGTRAPSAARGTAAARRRRSGAPAGSAGRRRCRTSRARPGRGGWPRIGLGVAQPRIAVEQPARQPLEAHRLLDGQAEMAQLDLAVRARQRERARDGAAIVILLDQLPRAPPRCRRSRS